MARAKIMVIVSGMLAVLLYFYGVTVTGAADWGIGIYASTNAETMMEGNELCITYKGYNPFDTDIWATLSAEGDIANLTTYVDKPVFVPKYTSHNDGKPMKICFSKENLHADCLVGTAFCRTCEPRTYSGTVSATTAAAPGSGSGPSVSAASGQALRLTVTCNPNPLLPFRFLVYASGITVLAFAAWWAKKNVRPGIGFKKKGRKKAD